MPYQLYVQASHSCKYQTLLLVPMYYNADVYAHINKCLLPVYAYPICLQTTVASVLPQ